MSAAEKTVSALIESQLPDFVNAEHPQFKRFLELYYQWMEQNNPDGISNTAGNTIYHAMQIQDYRDIDETPPEFVKYFKDEILPYFPENTSLSTQKIIKAAREFYSKKGSDESLRWLFKALYDEDIEINYPKEQILITSDGKWVQPKAFRIAVTEQNKNLNVNLLERRQVVGVDSGATCVVESANRNIDPTNGKEILEIYVSNLKKLFNNGEFIEIAYVDENGTEQVFTDRIIGTISNIFVDSNIRTDPSQRRRGLLYNVGDPVVFVGGLGLTAEANDAAAIVGNVTLGSIEGVITTFKGYGYRLYSNTEVIVLRSSGDDPNANQSTDLRVANINITACTANSQRNYLERITYDKSVIDYLGSTTIGDANLAAFTLNTRNIVLNVTEDDADDYFLNYAVVWANGNNYTDALFTGKIATPNGNTKILGTVDVSTSNVVIGSNTAFDVELKVGQKLEVAGERRTIDAITNNFYLTVTAGYSGTLTAQSAYRIGNFGARGGFGTEYTGDLLIYDVANTGVITDVLNGAQLNVLSTTDTAPGGIYTADKSFTFNSITTYLLPTNANSQLVQALDFETINTGGIDLITVINGGGGFRSEPTLDIKSYYDTQLSENYDYNAEYEDKANTRQIFTDLGAIAHLWIVNGGSLYSVNDTITFDGRGYGGNAYVQSVNATGAITSVVLTDRGEGHLVRPNVIVNRASPTYNAVSGTVNVSASNNFVIGTLTNFISELAVNDIIRVNSELRKVTSITNNEYLTVNSDFFKTGTANTIELQDGEEATLTAYLYGDGSVHTIQTSAVGRVRDIRLLYRGYDYVNVPIVSLKVYDAVLNPVPESSAFTETEYIYQGASLETATFKANVKSYSRTTNVLRMYGYSGLIDPFVSLKTANLTCAVNVSANVPVPSQYPAEIRATGISDPNRPGTFRYGNGRARARATFANGLIEFNGFYLNSDGFLSADKVLQDGEVYHNFSYIVQSEKNLVEYETPVKNIVHPAGMSLISKTILKNEEDQFVTQDSNVHIIMPGPGPDAVTVMNSYSNIITGYQTIFNPPPSSLLYANSKVNVGDLFIVDDGDRIPISRVVTEVISNTSVRVDGNFIYPGTGLMRSNVVFNNIPGTVTVNPPLPGTGTINPPVTGTVNVNPQITGTVNIDTSGIQLTYNAISGTAGISSGANTVTGSFGALANGTVDITSGSNVVSGVFTSLANGTVDITGGANTVTGSSTTFELDLVVGNSIRVNNEIRLVQSITSNTDLVVNSNFTNDATTQSAYRGSTRFELDLAANSVIRINNEVKLVDTISSNDSLTVNSNFTDSGTGNTVFKGSTRFLSQLEVGDIIRINNEPRIVQNIIDNNTLNVNSNFTTTATGRTIFLSDGYITTNTAKFLTGNGTTFVTNIAANDIIVVNNQIRQVINVVNNTFLEVNSRFFYAGTDNTCYVRSNVITGNNTTFLTNIANGDIISVDGEIREVINVASNTSLTVNAIMANSISDYLLYKRSNVVVGSGTNFDPQVNVGDIITVNNEIREVTNVISDTLMEVNSVFTYYGTSKSIYKQNNQVLGVSTFFDINLLANNLVVVNNQIREVISIDSGTLMTVNSPFTYYGTGNTIGKLANSTVYVYGNTDLLTAYVEEQDNISFNIAAANVYKAQTGTVQIFNVNTQVIGTSTSFNTELQANDLIMINGDVRKVVNVSGTSALNVNSPFTLNTSNQLIYKLATIQNTNIVSISANTMLLNIAIPANVSSMVYLVDPNYRKIVTIGGTVNCNSGNVIFANTSNTNTPESFIGIIYIGNEVIVDTETRTVTNVQANQITVDIPLDSPGDDKYLKVFENHSFNVVTFSAY
jgi:hypothetical protein